MDEQELKDRSKAAGQMIASQNYEAALQLLVTVTASGQADAIDWNNLGTCYRRTARMPEAIDCFRKASTLDSAGIVPRHNLGHSLREMGFLDQAAQSYEAILRIDPTYEAAWRELLRIHSSRKDSETTAQIMVRCYEALGPVKGKELTVSGVGVGAAEAATAGMSEQEQNNVATFLKKRQRRRKLFIWGGLGLIALVVLILWEFVL